MSNIPKDRTIYILEQNNRRPLKVYRSEQAARKVMTQRPSYHMQPRLPIQGGILWKVQEGQAWTVLDDMPGDYHPTHDLESAESVHLVRLIAVVPNGRREPIEGAHIQALQEAYSALYGDNEKYTISVTDRGAHTINKEQS